MPDESLKRRFERALSAEAYRTAWRFSCRLAHSREDAEDLLQEALGQAWLRFVQLRQPARFTSWLLSIVRRCHLTRLRRAGRRPRVAAAYAELASREPAAAFQAEVLDAVAGLAEPQRTLLTLVYMEGLSHREAAAVLGIRPGAVRMRLTRARRALRAQLERSEERRVGKECRSRWSPYH